MTKNVNNLTHIKNFIRKFLPFLSAISLCLFMSIIVYVIGHFYLDEKILYAFIFLCSCVVFFFFSYLAKKIKHRELLLKVSEEKYRAIIENTKDLIWTMDVNTLKYIFISNACYDIYGYTAEEYLQLTAKDTLSPESFGLVLEVINSEIEKNKIDKRYVPSATIEVQKYHKDGSLFWCEISAKILSDDTGELTTIVATTRNIEQRKKIELALKESESRYGLMADNINDMFWTMNVVTQKFTYMSPACYKITGFTPAEYLNMTFKDILPEHSFKLATDILGSEIIKNINKRSEDIEGVVLEIEQYHKDGSLIWIEVSGKLIPTLENNSILEIVATTRPIDDRKKIELALKESEARYSLIANTIRDIMCIIDAQTLQYLYVTGASYKLTGFTNEELTKMTIKDMMPAEYFEIVSNIIDVNLKKYYAGELEVPAATFEIQQYHKDGSLVWIEIAAEMTFKEDNTPDKIITINRLIEERKKIELALKESENRYGLMANNINDMFWTMDVVTQKFTYMSPACYEITGFTIDEYLNMTLKDVLPEYSLKIVTEVLENEIDKVLNINKQSEGTVLEVQQYHKNGSLIWIEVSAKLLPTLKDDSIVEIVATTRPIDKRKQLELALKESEEKYRAITENMRDGMFMMDIKTMKYLYKNKTANEMTGYTAEETINLTVYDAFPPESVSKIAYTMETEFKKYYAGELPGLPYATFEVQQYHKDGHLMWVEISSRTLPPNDEGILTTLIGTTRVIDDRKAIERKILEQNIELEQQQENLMIQKAALEKANATKDRFFSIIAHDLRNSMSSLSNIASIFDEYYKDMTQEQIIENIGTFVKNTSNTGKLLENLLNWSRANMGEFKFNTTKNEIKTIVDATFEDVGAQAVNKDIKLIFENNITTEYVYCDYDMINTILRNLISNAIKFSESGKKITIITNNYLEDEKYIVFSVKDEGVGMNTDTINKLFRIDTKVSTKGTNGEPGTGLGLILCKEFIEKHNCKIWVESEINKGTTFSFTLLNVTV